MYKTLSTLSSLSIIPPLLVGLYLYRYLSKDAKLIFLIVVVGTLPQMIHLFFRRSPAEMISYNAYTVCEFFIYFFFFFHKISTKVIRLLLLGIAVIYVVLCLHFILQLGLSLRFINELAVANGASCLLIIGLYLYETFIADKGDLEKSNPFFWFTTGILLYAACTTLVYSLWQRIVEHPDSVLQQLWNLQNIFNIITYGLFTVGFIKARRTQTM